MFIDNYIIFIDQYIIFFIAHVLDNHHILIYHQKIEIYYVF